LIFICLLLVGVASADYAGVYALVDKDSTVVETGDNWPEGFFFMEKGSRLVLISEPVYQNWGSPEYSIEILACLLAFKNEEDGNKMAVFLNGERILQPVVEGRDKNGEKIFKYLFMTDQTKPNEDGQHIVVMLARENVEISIWNIRAKQCRLVPLR